MNELQCYNCGHTSSDPGGVLDTYECSKCGQRTLVRLHPLPPDKVGQAIAGGVIGIALGAGAIGLPGMFLGAIVGGLLGWSYKP
jgi:hypothetical protein